MSDTDGKIMAPMRDTFYVFARNSSFPFPYQILSNHALRRKFLNNNFPRVTKAD